jgi:hypothetical protein
LTVCAKLSVNSLSATALYPDALMTSTMRAAGIVTAAAMFACGDHADPPTPSASSRSPPQPLVFVPRCADGDPTEQRHGATCLCCHSDEFGVGGSVDRGGSPVTRVVVTDARGDVASMAPNLFANFFRHFPMSGPFRAVVVGPDGRTASMKADSPSADCNACHYAGGPSPPIHGP